MSRIQFLLIVIPICLAVGCRCPNPEKYSMAVNDSGSSLGMTLSEASLPVYEMFLNREAATSTSMINVFERQFRTEVNAEYFEKIRDRQKRSLQNERDFLLKIGKSIDQRSDRLYYYEYEKDGSIEQGWVVLRGNVIRHKFPIGQLAK